MGFRRRFFPTRSYFLWDFARHHSAAYRRLPQVWMRGGVLALCAVNTDWLSSRDTLCHLCSCSIESDWGHHVPQHMETRMGIFWLYTRKNLINWLLRTSFVCCKLIMWTAKVNLLLSNITGSWYYITAWHFTRGCMSTKKKKKFV